MYNIIQLNDKDLSELQSIAKELGIKKTDSLKKEDLVYKILDEQAIVGATQKVAAEKSMLERIGNMQREQKEYREYIEQWVHEMKTPITAMKLLCENHLSEFTRQFPVELEKSNRLTEQVLSTQILTITVILLLLFACYFISTWILFRKSVTEIS